MSVSAARIDLDAIRSNVATLKRSAGDAAVMAVVKADGYGHGMVQSATAALDAGAGWLGVAMADEALELRRSGITAPVLAWLLGPGDDWVSVVASGVDVGVYATWALRDAAAAAQGAGRPARVHLKVDSGLGRGGAQPADWPELVAAAAKAQADGTVEVVGIWSHLAYADQPGNPTIEAQRIAFEDALEVATQAGVEPSVRHLANSAATLRLPQCHYDLVRPGVAVYGLSPGPDVGVASELGLTPAMSLTTQVALTKRAPAGHGVSYGHQYLTERETTLALVPLGYADGVPRHLTNLGEVAVGGRRYRIAGRVCMDQFVLDVGDDAVSVGDEVLLFGSGSSGEPTADDWAAALGTINYEIVSGVGARVPRVYEGSRT
ncbi:MAG TPA: alanine racemase [Mycobacteriales bacterium]|jgi:alanine racemase|nr:alanine racemase [Mycobacteriales bacterium]